MAENKTISTAKRKEIENIVYSVFDAIDPSKANSNYYKDLFSKMDNQEFYKFLERRLPFRTHISVFKVEPKMDQVFKAFKIINKPLLEKVNLPYLFKDENGNPIKTKEALVGYINIKRMKQFLSKKNSNALDITKRDMKTGMLIREDKGGKMTDREFESLTVQDLTTTMDEFATIRADAMRAKSEAYNIISNTGEVSINDIDVEKDDSLSKNLLNVYLMGSNLYSNIVCEDYYTPLTLKNRQNKNVKRV